ncbi:TetR family transcriptional regulator [Microbulbifer hainanensis]|uniref:TetR family transcriptional regulator n=1 Tax=Microbulbifer hainanensis TaxID=2735675 RepID=UPI0018669963|nr:TetR family transcriptional regulator [Microbulbifer hainanensis]
MRNSEASKERILEAAMAEFSAYGIAGARVDRIAKAAGCNKNLIYIYFESKEKLFTTVLEKNLVRVYQELAFASQDLASYAGRLFDFAIANPDLMRLLAWSNLEQAATSSNERVTSRDAKIAELQKAQETGQIAETFTPDFLLTAIMTLATGWTAANPFGLLHDPQATKHPAALRKDLEKAVRLLTAHTSEDS